MRLVPTKYIPQDGILAETLFTVDGQILVKDGTILTPSLIEKINQNSIYMVYVQDQHSIGEITRLIEPRVRQKGHLIIKRIFDAASHNKSDGTHDPQSIFELMDDLKQLMDDVIYDIAGVKDRQLEYIDIKNVNSYLYSSALNVAILSILIGWEIGLNGDPIKQLFYGAIFHDIGLSFLPKEVLYKTEPLTMADKGLIINHPKTGHNYLKSHNFLSAYVKAIALQHHEHIDGTGYPLRAKDGEIHKLAQIVGIADIFDAMTSDRPYRAALPASEAIEFLMGSAGRHFDLSIVTAFVKKVNPYPINTLVKLSNGEIAVVEEVDSQFPLRPKLRIIHEAGLSPNGKMQYRYEPIDLRKMRTLTILGIHY